MSQSDREISRLEQANTLGLSYLRTMVTLNGGAILALLTYLGNSATTARFFIPLDTIKCSLASFLVALCSLLLALLISYTFTASSPETGWSKFWNDWIIPLNAFCALVSLFGFTVGSLVLVLGATPT